MIKTKIIRDPIHKDIFIHGDEINIMDSIEVQRLRNIKQTGLTCLVYPSANHTRFEHSLGTMYIAGEISENLENVNTNLTRIAGLLHDIGHPPFSHTLEISGYSHEYFTRKKIKKMEFENYSPKEILEVLSPKGFEGILLSGDVDADRMDYLVRDSYHTGVAYGSFDLARLMRCITVFEDVGPKLGVIEKGMTAVESLLIARYQMYPTVYMHPASRIAETMLKNAVITAIDENLFSLKDLSIMDDIDLISKLRSSEDSEGHNLIKMLDRRDLFKNIVTYRYGELTPEERWALINLTEENIKEFEYELSEKFETKIFLDIPGYPKMDENRITVIMNGKKYRLDEISPLAKSLKSAYIKSWDVRIYAAPKKAKELAGELDNKKESILEFVKEKPIDSVLLNVLKEYDVIKGRGNLITIAKDNGITESELFSELQKLVFCGLVNEKVVKVRGTFRYDYSVAVN